jgi:hypothetical protein
MRTLFLLWTAWGALRHPAHGITFVPLGAVLVWGAMSADQTARWNSNIYTKSLASAAEMDYDVRRRVVQTPEE